MLYTEIQDGRQIWQEDDFWEKSTVHSAKQLLENIFWKKLSVHSMNTLWVKNFVEITILHHFRDKYVFTLFFLQNSTWPPKMVG